MKDNFTVDDRKIIREVCRKTALVPSALVTMAVIFELPVKEAVPVGILAFGIAYPLFVVILRLAFASADTCISVWKKIFG